MYNQVKIKKYNVHLVDTTSFELAKICTYVIYIYIHDMGNSASCHMTSKSSGKSMRKLTLNIILIST